MRALRILAWILAAQIALAVCVSAYEVAQTFEPTAPTHNAAGGYVDACGDLPGLIGDDC
jgi:hypothetical protein